MTEQKKENYTTSQQDFALFEQEVRYHLKEFGLLDWEVTITHAEETKMADSLAECHVDIIARCCTIGLAKNWQEMEITDRQIRKTAYHEVLELLLTDLASVYQWNFSNETERQLSTNARRHEVIRRLENRYFDKGEKQPSAEKTFDVKRYPDGSGLGLKERNHLNQTRNSGEPYPIMPGATSGLMMAEAGCAREQEKGDKGLK